MSSGILPGYTFIGHAADVVFSLPGSDVPAVLHSIWSSSSARFMDSVRERYGRLPIITFS
jgi:hypothetical protein